MNTMMADGDEPAVCNENWHVFDGGLPQPGQFCQCGRKRAGGAMGELIDVPEPEPAADTAQRVPTIVTPLGFEVIAPPGEEYREHTAERWRERDRSSYDFALYLVRELGLTNKSKIWTLVTEHRKARQLEGISRNSVIALFNDRTEFKPGEIDEIIRRRSSLLSADVLDKLEELLEKAKSAKDLGAASMALTAVYNVKQLSSGGATRISGQTSDGAKARSFDELRKRAQAKLGQQRAAMRDVTPVPLAIEDKETVRVGDLEKAHESHETARMDPGNDSTVPTRRAAQDE